jgi:uncharacterized protein
VAAATIATTVAVTLLSMFAPERYAATAVGVAFLAATWILVLRHDASVVRAYGLGLGGLLEPERLSARRVVRDFARAVLWVLPFVAVIFPLFWVGYRMWFRTRGHFVFRMPASPFDEIAAQLLVIALPEEAFFRGYLQTELDRIFPPRVRFLGATLGLGLLISAAVFAVGHFLTIRSAGRLAVFFPALVFGFLRARTGGIGAGVAFHAACNLFAAALRNGYGVG